MKKNDGWYLEFVSYRPVFAGFGGVATAVFLTELIRMTKDLEKTKDGFFDFDLMSLRHWSRLSEIEINKAIRHLRGHKILEFKKICVGRYLYKVSYENIMKAIDGEDDPSIKTA